ncbi:hypothetical protein ACFY30_33930 [Streptomyces sp. NPDC000345]|uniref:hypothetical protein n=1 Tax=Streptomyces sp. NPDC000345 TaxID=3364537 RepID=UPI0036BC6405
MLTLIRNSIGFAVGAVVFYGDAVAACALALLYSVLGAQISWALAAAAAAGVAVGVLCFVRAVPRSRPVKQRLPEWAGRLDD